MFSGVRSKYNRVCLVRCYLWSIIKITFTIFKFLAIFPTVLATQVVKRNKLTYTIFSNILLWLFISYMSAMWWIWRIYWIFDPWNPWIWHNFDMEFYSYQVQEMSLRCVLMQHAWYLYKKLNHHEGTGIVESCELKHSRNDFHTLRDDKDKYPSTGERNKVWSDLDLKRVQLDKTVVSTTTEIPADRGYTTCSTISQSFNNEDNGTIQITWFTVCSSEKESEFKLR